MTVTLSEGSTLTRKAGRETRDVPDDVLSGEAVARTVAA
jgi:hypothetical protein